MVRIFFIVVAGHITKTDESDKFKKHLQTLLEEKVLDSFDMQLPRYAYSMEKNHGNEMNGRYYIYFENNRQLISGLLFCLDET